MDTCRREYLWYKRYTNFQKRRRKKWQKLDKIQEVKVAEQQIEVDPRSKTTADQAFNYIATGKPEMPVGGQKRMLAEKRRNSKAY